MLSIEAARMRPFTEVDVAHSLKSAIWAPGTRNFTTKPQSGITRGGEGFLITISTARPFLGAESENAAIPCNRILAFTQIHVLGAGGKLLSPSSDQRILGPNVQFLARRNSIRSCTYERNLPQSAETPRTGKI